MLVVQSTAENVCYYSSNWILSVLLSHREELIKTVDGHNIWTLCVWGTTMCVLKSVWAFYLFVVSIVTQLLQGLFSRFLSLSSLNWVQRPHLCVAAVRDLDWMKWSDERGRTGKVYIEGGNSVCIFLFDGLSLFLPSDKAQCKIIFRLYWPRPDFSCRFVFGFEGDSSDSSKERSIVRAMAWQ